MIQTKCRKNKVGHNSVRIKISQRMIQTKCKFLHVYTYVYTYVKTMFTPVLHHVYSYVYTYVNTKDDTNKVQKYVSMTQQC